MNILELFLTAVGLSMDAFAVSVCMGLTMPKATLKKALIVGLYFGIFQAAMPLTGYLLGTQFADKITAYDHWIAFTMLVAIGGKMILESLGKKELESPKTEAAIITQENDREEKTTVITEEGVIIMEEEAAAAEREEAVNPEREEVMVAEGEAAGIGSEEVVITPGQEEASLAPGKMLPLALATSIDALAMGVSFAFLKVNIIQAVLFIGLTTLLLSMTGVKVGNVFGTRFKSKAEFVGGAILVLMGLKILLEHLTG